MKKSFTVVIDTGIYNVPTFDVTTGITSFTKKLITINERIERSMLLGWAS